MTTNFRTISPAFIPSSKPGYASETRVERGARCVHGDKELLEKPGRKDPCPCGAGRRLQELLHALRMLLTGAGAGITSASEGPRRRNRSSFVFGFAALRHGGGSRVRERDGALPSVCRSRGLPSAEALGYFRDAPPGLVWFRVSGFEF